MLRLPEGMRQSIKDAADKSGRSMNAEIIHRLQTTIETGDYNPGENVTRGANVIHIPDELAEKISLAAKGMKRSPENQALATLEAAYLPLRGSAR